MGCSKHELYSTRNMLYSQKNEIGFPRSTFFTSYFIDGRVSLRKQPFFLPPRHLRRFALIFPNVSLIREKVRDIPFARAR